MASRFDSNILAHGIALQELICRSDNSDVFMEMGGQGVFWRAHKPCAIHVFKDGVSGVKESLNVCNR